MPTVMTALEPNKPAAVCQTAFRRFPARIGFMLAGMLAAGLVCATAARAQSSDDDLGSEYRLTLSPHHAIQGDLTGFGELGYHWNPDEESRAATVLWPGLIYSVARWAQLTAGLRSLYTDNEGGADTLELRPFAGIKLFLPNRLDWHLYNYTRYEYRDTQDRDTHDWAAYHRIRSQTGAEIPLVSRGRAWQTRTWYGLADVEPFYRFDQDVIDSVRVRTGLAYILSDRFILEFLYYAKYSRPADGGGLEYDENIFRVNLKIGLNRGVLRRLMNPNNDD